MQENPLLQGAVTSVFRAWHLLSNDPWAQLEPFLNLLYHLPTEGACPGKSLKPSDPMFSPSPHGLFVPYARGHVCIAVVRILMMDTFLGKPKWN